MPGHKQALPGLMNLTTLFIGILKCHIAFASHRKPQTQEFLLECRKRLMHIVRYKKKVNRGKRNIPQSLKMFFFVNFINMVRLCWGVYVCLLNLINGSDAVYDFFTLIESKLYNFNIQNNLLAQLLSFQVTGSFLFSSVIQGLSVCLKTFAKIRPVAKQATTYRCFELSK